MNLEELDTGLQKGHDAIKIFSLNLKNCWAFLILRKVGTTCEHQFPWSRNGQLQDTESFNSVNNLALIGPVITSHGRKFKSALSFQIMKT